MAVQYSDFRPDPAGFDPPERPPRGAGGVQGHRHKQHERSPGVGRPVRIRRADSTFRPEAEFGFLDHPAHRRCRQSSQPRSQELRRGGRYTFRVRAYHEQGASDSDTVTITLPTSDTPDPGPGPVGIDVPEDVTAVSLAATSVELTWAGVARGTVEIEARTWKAGWAQVMTANATTGRATVANLEVEAPYTFRLRTRAGGGKVSAWSDEVSATTGDVSGGCRSGEHFLCLSEGRFEVQTHLEESP